jgi:hypothetical protein
MKISSNFSKAIEVQAIIDVSHVALRVGLLCPTFVTAAFWNSVEIERSEERLAAVIDESPPIHKLVGDDNTGTERVLCGPAICKWGVALTALVERFEGFGLVVVIGDFEEELDFRADPIMGTAFYPI